MPSATTSKSRTQSVSRPQGSSRQCARRSGMPAMRHSSAAGSALCVHTVKITAASKRASARRSTKRASARPSEACDSPASLASSAFCGARADAAASLPLPNPATHGASKAIRSWTAGTCTAAATPPLEASKVRRASGRLSARAASAGVVMSTSPSLSSRTASSRRTPLQRAFMARRSGRWRPAGPRRADAPQRARPRVRTACPRPAQRPPRRR